MIRKVLIANRGEIALRVLRACREMKIKTVAVYSTADKNSLHVKFADESVCIGPPAAKMSYLNMAAIMSAVEVSGADAVHPGYGFLSENSDFADICEQCNITFIGPTSKVIGTMGNKVEARRLAKEAGVPMLPGSPGPLANSDEAVSIASKIGYPVMLKAAAGGGGRGISVVHSAANLPNTLERLRTEAKAAFGSDEIYMEKFCVHPRHVEIQIMADKHGNVIHLGERDCTVQRKHQKLIEEAPSPAITPEIREAIGKAAVSLAKRVGYTNVGTVEFLVDEKKNFYFMEMNTRVQVEHPVTEMVTGIDIVKEQLRIAMGERLSVTQDQVKISGHAIECRINAENPDRMTPSPGCVTAFHAPGGPGIRVETTLYSGYHVVPYYDSMIAKVIAYGPNRFEAINKMLAALSELVVDGIDCNARLQKRILSHPRFQSAQYDTHFLEELLKG